MVTKTLINVCKRKIQLNELKNLNHKFLRIDMSCFVWMDITLKNVKLQMLNSNFYVNTCIYLSVMVDLKKLKDWHAVNVFYKCNEGA